MSDQKKQHKFRKSLTFKVLCGLVVLLVLGLVYNFIVAADQVLTKKLFKVFLTNKTYSC